MPEPQTKYVIRYANGLYLGSNKSRMVKSKELAVRFDTEEDALRRAKARASVDHSNKDIQQFEIVPYSARVKVKKRGKRWWE